MQSNNNVIIISVVALIVAGGAYWYFFTGTGNQSPLTADTAQNVAQSRFSSLVSELQPISFNTDIFTDPRFMALVDLTTPISPEATGRIDPFAPIPGVSLK